MNKYMKKISTTIAATMGLLILTAPIAATAMAIPVSFAATDPKKAVCEGVALTGTSCDSPAPGPTINSTIAVVINIISFIVGIAAVVMIIIGGFKYIISSGDSGNITSAKNTILYAIVGLVVVALAQVIVRFVLNNVSPT